MFREMQELERLISDFGSLARHRQLDVVSYRGEKYPLHALVVGPEDKQLPTFAMYGGVHGLEKIGSEIVLAWMRTVLNLLKWDRAFQYRMRETRLVFFPIVNPVGVRWARRSNGNRVDLMRNSPLDAKGRKGFIYSGHRISPWIPCYRGVESAAMEVEAQAMQKLAEEEIFPAKVSMSVDVHSGFGAVDRFWFPYAYTREPFPHLPEVYRLKEIFDSTYPNHFYEFEPTTSQYLINGDMWDYLYLMHLQKYPQNLFIPWTLEIGSWIWLKKNPLQIFSANGVWHPIRPHRHQRILRRHITLFDFLHRILLSPEVWTGLTSEQKQQCHKNALGMWYE